MTTPLEFFESNIIPRSMALGAIAAVMLYIFNRLPRSQYFIGHGDAWCVLGIRRLQRWMARSDRRKHYLHSPDLYLSAMFTTLSRDGVFGSM